MTRVCLVALLALALAGCGGNGGEPAAEPAAETEGTKRHTVAEHGFELLLPVDWRPISPSQALTEEELRTLREENPGIDRYVDAVMGPDSPIAFFAFDPDPVDGFATNLNVVVLPVGDAVSLDDLAEAAVEELERLPTRTSEVGQDRVELPAGEAVRLRYRQTLNTESGEQELATTQYNLVASETSYILTFTTLPKELERLEPVFQAAAESFRTAG